MRLMLKYLLYGSIAMDIVVIIYFLTIIDEIGLGIFLVSVLILLGMTGFIGLIYYLNRNK